jgi:hypothetical protein
MRSKKNNNSASGVKKLKLLCLQYNLILRYMALKCRFQMEREKGIEMVRNSPLRMHSPVDSIKKVGYILAIGMDPVYFVFDPGLQTTSTVTVRICND